MTQVTTDIAHDLKTPIGRLFLTLDAASECKDHASAQSLIAKAMNEVARITGTFEGLLRISQIESGARRLRFARIDLSALVTDIYDIYRDIVEDTGRSLRLLNDTTGVSSFVWGDADLLKQMCVNLVVNSIRHTPNGAWIAIGIISRSGSYTVFVNDNGPGIPEKERQRVFRRFYRLEKSRTTEGTGLGLSLVKAISDVHGANIALTDNKPGLAVSVSFSKIA